MVDLYRYTIFNKKTQTGEVSLKIEFHQAGTLSIECVAGRNLISRDDIGEQVHTFICFMLSLSLSLSSLFVCLFVRSFVCLFVCSFVCLFVLCVSPYFLLSFIHSFFWKLKKKMWERTSHIPPSTPHLSLSLFLFFLPYILMYVKGPISCLSCW